MAKRTKRVVKQAGKTVRLEGGVRIKPGVEIPKVAMVATEPDGTTVLVFRSPKAASAFVDEEFNADAGAERLDADGAEWESDGISGLGAAALGKL